MMEQNRQYALIFKGHSFEYEIQAIAKVFIPGIRFLLCRDGEIPDVPNRILTELSPAPPKKILSVSVQLNGKKSEKTETVAENTPKDETELALCRLLYTVLLEMTGYRPPWGLLTGIRPVRKVLQELDKGFTMEEAYRNIQEKYLVSDEKLRLACETARVQQPILPHSPKEVGLYISIPFCPTRCSYCSFVSHSMDTAWQLIPDYVENLCREIAVLGDMIRTYGLSVHSVYIGGGTPTSLTAPQLRSVMDAVSRNIDLSDTREYTVEAGRADTITLPKLQVIQEMGATRISINPQTFQDHVLKVIGRHHTAQQVLEAFYLARELGFDNINMDLIAGLPTDTETGFRKTLQQVMELCPDSITVHTLTLKRSADLYGTDQSEQAALVTEMTVYAAREIPMKGYRPYYLYRQKNTLGNLENVGYSKPGKENLYNILIMDETQTILGAGCAASTKLVTANGQITRVMNYKFPFEYIRQFDEMLKKKKKIAEILERME